MRTFDKYKKNLKVVKSNGENYVKSYDTLVAKINWSNGKLIQLGNWSMTTQKHINYAANELGLELVEETTEANEVKKEKNDNVLGFMKAFMMLGDCQNSGIEDQVKYKERIVFATMRSKIPNWQKPSDWNTISSAEKLNRLNNLQTIN